MRGSACQASLGNALRGKKKGVGIQRAYEDDQAEFSRKGGRNMVVLKNRIENYRPK
jgi:hypothetical protein